MCFLVEKSLNILTAKPVKQEGKSELNAEIRKQAEDFDRELSKFLQGGDIVKKEIESLGSVKFRHDHNTVSCILSVLC